MSPTKPIVLVACCGPKLAQAAKAQDIYTSDLFVKSRAWAERFGSRWFILSAKHGLLPPEVVIQPYDMTLQAMGAGERIKWGARVAQAFGTPDEPVVFLAGKLYRAWAARRSYAAPMAGLSIGHQKAWLKRQLEGEAAIA